MFGKKKDSFIELTKLSSLVASNVDVTGDLSFVDGLRIDGQVHGNVQSRQGTKSLLVLSDQGSITGNVRSHDAIINGVIIGDLEVEHFLELQANARVTGNITYRQLRMDCGAAVDGKLNKVTEGGAMSNVVELPGNTNAATA
jgi:cytoskeletal protein CcmA (bactofilin family)